MKEEISIFMKKAQKTSPFLYSLLTGFSFFPLGNEKLHFETGKEAQKIGKPDQRYKMK